MNVDNIVISKLAQKYLIAYLDRVIRPLVLILPKRSNKLNMEIKIKAIN